MGKLIFGSIFRLEKGEKFCNYVNKLIEKDIRKTIECNDDKIESIIKPQIDENHLMALIEKIKKILKQMLIKK